MHLLALFPAPRRRQRLDAFRGGPPFRRGTWKVARRLLQSKLSRHGSDGASIQQISLGPAVLTPHRTPRPDLRLQALPWSPHRKKNLCARRGVHLRILRYAARPRPRHRLRMATLCSELNDAASAWKRRGRLRQPHSETARVQLTKWGTELAETSAATHRSKGIETLSREAAHGG
jgi:hypothetical protein